MPAPTIKYTVELRHRVEVELTDVEVLEAEKATRAKFEMTDEDEVGDIDIILEAIFAGKLKLDPDHVHDAEEA